MNNIERNGIATVGAYRGQLIHRIQCGGERFFYIGSDIHTVYPTPEQCRAAIDRSAARLDSGGGVWYSGRN